MKKSVLFFGAAVLAFAACTTDLVDDGAAGNGVGNEWNGTQTSSGFTLLKSDQARILNPKVSVPVRPYAVVEPGSDIDWSYSNATEYPADGAIQPGKTYVVSKDTTLPISQENSDSQEVVKIYVKEKVTVTFGQQNYQKPMEVYILKGAKVTWTGNDADGVHRQIKFAKIYCLGEFYQPTENVRGIRISNEAGSEAELHLYNPDYVFEIPGGIQVDAGRTFESYGEVQVNGRAILIGTTTFHNKVSINGIFQPYGGVTTFGDCAYINGQINNQGTVTPATIHVYQYLKCTAILAEGNKGLLTINLYDATFDIGSLFEPGTYDGDPQNRIIADTSSCSLVINGITDSSDPYFSSVRFTGTEDIPGSGDVFIHNNGWYTGGEWGSLTGENCIKDKVDLSHLLKGALYLQGVFYIGNVYGALGAGFGILPSSELLQNPGDVLINTADPEDVGTRATCGNSGPDGSVVLPPVADVEHKYSATGIDFGPDGVVYISWHSNNSSSASADDDTDINGNPHKPGTNVGGGTGDSDEDPSLDGASDWGGLIDVLYVDRYNEYNHHFEESWLNNEHKYNFVKYHNGKLYLASTSNKVRAALHVVNVGAGSLIDTVGNYRVNLTGNSANCVEVVEGTGTDGVDELVTISGRSRGAINWFDITDRKNQTKYAINPADTAESQKFGGKYISLFDDKVVTLSNPSNAEIRIYNAADKSLEKTISTGVSLVPYDGKNVCQVYDGCAYLCAGQSGFYVYDLTSGQCVGSSRKHANGCDVTEDYIFLATGDGMTILDRYEKNEDGTYKTVKQTHYTGRGFIYPGNVTIDNTEVKESANFVRVRGNDIFVAYGMYGLRIYHLDQLLGNN